MYLFYEGLLENYCFVLLTNRAPPQISYNRPDMRTGCVRIHTKKCKPSVFQPMDPSQLVTNERATTVTDNPPPLNVLRSVQRESATMLSLKKVCPTHIPLVRHIPPVVLPDVAELFRWALQRAVDAVDPYESAQRFTRVMMLLAAVLAAPK